MPKHEKETAYVLDEERFSSPSVEPQNFVGFPGRWSAGEPVAVRDLGLSEEEAATKVAELGLPLKKTSAESKLAGRERPAGQMQPFASGAELASQPEAQVERDASPVPGLGAEEARERALYDAEHPQHPAMTSMLPSAPEQAPKEPSRAELNEQAAKVGVEEPAKLPNKDAVAKAIEDAQGDEG